MLSLAEAARLKADNQLTREEIGAGITYEAETVNDAAGRTHPFDFDSGSGRKRPRVELEDSGGLQGALPVQRGSHQYAHKDPVEAGLISESRGKALFDL
jgi:hypothetical protein